MKRAYKVVDRKGRYEGRIAWNGKALEATGLAALLLLSERYQSFHHAGALTYRDGLPFLERLVGEHSHELSDPRLVPERQSLD